jgi:hypothetical protein
MLKPKATSMQNLTINARPELSSAHSPHGQSEVKKGSTIFKFKRQRQKKRVAKAQSAGEGE